MEQNKKALFQITEAAHACGLSRSTLLRMEEKGLLTPACIAAESGRRYYDNHNVARIMQIEKLKAMGLGTEEIAGYFARGGEVTDLLSVLERRQREIRPRGGGAAPARGRERGNVHSDNDAARRDLLYAPLRGAHHRGEIQCHVRFLRSVRPSGLPPFPRADLHHLGADGLSGGPHWRHALPLSCVRAGAA